MNFTHLILVFVLYRFISNLQKKNVRFSGMFCLLKHTLEYILLIILLLLQFQILRFKSELFKNSKPLL